jgi:hypothetical protein
MKTPQNDADTDDLENEAKTQTIDSKWEHVRKKVAMLLKGRESHRLAENFQTSTPLLVTHNACVTNIVRGMPDHHALGQSGFTNRSLARLLSMLCYSFEPKSEPPPCLLARFRTTHRYDII